MITYKSLHAQYLPTHQKKIIIYIEHNTLKATKRNPINRCTNLDYRSEPAIRHMRRTSAEMRNCALQPPAEKIKFLIRTEYAREKLKANPKADA